MIRYSDKLFTATQIKKTTVKYATANNQEEIPVDLYADVFQAKQTIDTDTARKWILLVHGGGFRNGDKAEMNDEAKEWFARRGYVAISINYRLDASVRDQEAQKKAALVAVSDMQAAIRFFKGSASVYHLDPELNAGFGNSSGGITVYMAGVMAEIAESIDLVYPDMPQPINTNNPGYDSTVKACIAQAGLIYDEYRSAHIDSSDCPLFYDFHGDEDIVVPFTTAEATQDDLMASGLNATLDAYLGYGHLGFPQDEVEEKTIQWLLDNF